MVAAPRYSPLLLCLLALVAGCDESSRGYPSAKVNGTVTLDGQELEQGTINFISADKSGDDSAPIKAGKFRATKVPVGKVRVFVIASKETGKMVPGSGEPVPETVSLIPVHYAQGIEITVQGDESDRKIELTSTP